MPEMHAGDKADLYEFQAYTKERVSDLDNDIKERFKFRYNIVHIHYYSHFTRF